MLKSRGISVLTYLILLLPGTSKSQDLNYQEIFGNDWLRAEEFERENRYWMEPVLEKYDIPYHVAIAVVFPELIRYSALMDRMETTLLKALYINLGEDYANFSVGRFQIKPSFAELIHSETSESTGRRSGISFSQPEDFDDITSYRKTIIANLEDPKTEFNYVIAFLKICEKKYKTGKMDEEDKLKFLATAYNCGIDKSREQVQNMIGKKFFSTKIIKSVTYCYSDISLSWYRQKMNNRLNSSW